MLVIKRVAIFFVGCFMTLAVLGQSLYSNLPLVTITTNGNQPISSTDTYVPGTISIKSSDATQNITTTMQIRGRGNSTWNFPKKPYRIKLDAEAKLLGMPAKNKDWVLLANYADKTLMRNALAFEIGKFLEMEYTPPYRFVDVVLNGEFIGNYLLTDQIEVAKNRIPVEKQDISMVQLPDISGGYLAELDGFAEREQVWFQTSRGVKVSVKYPDSDDINAQQLDYFTNYLKSYEDVLFSDWYNDANMGFRSQSDTASLVNWYIASELTGNSDCFWSTYVYKKRFNDRMFFGPLWDFDIAFNNDNRLGNATQKLMRNAAHNPRLWINRMFTDEKFVAAVERRWTELQNKGLDQFLENVVNSLQNELSQSQQLNFNKWNNLGQRVYLEQALFNTYGEGVAFLKSYLQQRVTFLNSYLGFVPKSFDTEPFYYRIYNQNTGLALDVSNQSTANNTNLVLWQAVDGKTSQQWRIVSLGNELYRVENRNSGLNIKGNGRNVSLIQSTLSATDEAQKWAIKSIAPGLYGFVNSKTGYAIDNSGGRTSNGSAVIEWDNQTSANLNQQWVIQKLELLTSLPSLTNKIISATVYPNPATTWARVVFNLNTPADIQLNVRNLAGAVLYSTEVANALKGRNEVTIPIGSLGLSAGIYMVEINIPGDVPTICRLIVK